MASWPLDTQSTILILQVLLTGVGIMASIIIAQKYGEGAASRFMLREEKRVSHATRCVEQMGTISGSISDPRMVFYCSTHPGLAPRLIRLESLSYEASFMVQHLSSGYKGTWQQVDNYVKQFNTLNGDSFKIIVPLMGSIAEVCKTGKAIPNLEDQILMGLNSVLTQAFESDREIQAEADLKNNRVLIGGSVMAYGPESANYNEIASECSRLIRAQLDALREIWQKAQCLSEARSLAIESMHRIEVDVSHGSPLAGWCDSGVKAGLESKVSEA